MSLLCSLPCSRLTAFLLRSQGGGTHGAGHPEAPAARAGWRFPVPSVFLQDEKQVYATITACRHWIYLPFFFHSPKHSLTQGMTHLGFATLQSKNLIKCCGFGGKTQLMENLPGLCYKLSMPVPPGSASPEQSHLSDLQPSHNENKQPMFCMVTLHLRRTLHVPPVPSLFVLAKAPCHRCHSKPRIPLSDIHTV